MAKFTDAEFRAIVNSDNQLWAKSTAGVVTPELCEELGLPEGTTGIVKQIDTPALGGLRTWVYPKDSKEFFESFGPTVRAEIKERERERDEEARRAHIERLAAEARTAEASAEASGSAEGAGPEGGVPASSESLQVSTTEAAPPHVDLDAGGTSFAGRRDALARGVSELEAYIAEANKRLKQFKKELLAIDAALEIMNASEDDGAELDDVPTEVDGS